MLNSDESVVLQKLSLKVANVLILHLEKNPGTAVSYVRRELVRECGQQRWQIKMMSEL